MPEILPVENDIRIAKIEEPSSLFSGNDILWTLNLNEKAFAITATDIIDIEENISFPIPQEFGLPIQTIGMEDLNLIFLLNDGGEIISYSPASDKFSGNNISIPTDSEIVSMGSYLTYIYLADRKNSQIYRYPRAEGGFGEKSDWLKDTLDLSGMSAMAINENIFISTGSDVTKLFRGKIEALDLEETTVPLEISSIALGEETGNLFVLDKENSRIVSYDEGGRIKVQYYHPVIRSSSGLALDEKNGLIYITSEESIRTIPLQ